METIPSLFLSPSRNVPACILGLALLLLAGSSQAAVVLTSSLYSGSSVNMTTDVGTGMTTNVDWVHFITGAPGWVPGGGTPGVVYSTGTADLAKNVLPLISRSLSYTPRLAGPLEGSVVATSPATSFTYTDAAGGSPSGSSANSVRLYNLNMTMTVTVADTNPYVLSLYGSKTWGPITVTSASLSGGGTSVGATSIGIGNGIAEMYRMDFAFQAATSGETLTVVFGTANVGQANDFPAATLSTVPEPTTWALLAIGLTTVVVFRRRRTA